MVYIHTLTPQAAVSTDNKRTASRSAMVKAVLAVLASRRGQPVSTDTLCSLLWDDPPIAPASNLRTFIAQTRTLLGPDANLLRTHRCGPGGATAYQLDIDPGHSDLTAFEAYLARARSAWRTKHWDIAARSATAATNVWTGEACGFPESRGIRTMLVALEHAHADATELAARLHHRTTFGTCPIMDTAWHYARYPWRSSAAVAFMRDMFHHPTNTPQPQANTYSYPPRSRHDHQSVPVTHRTGDPRLRS